MGNVNHISSQNILAVCQSLFTIGSKWIQSSCIGIHNCKKLFACFLMLDLGQNSDSINGSSASFLISFSILAMVNPWRNNQTKCSAFLF